MQDVFKALIHSLLAMLGAMARLLHIKETQQMELIRFVSGCFIAAFTGIMIYFVADSLHLEGNLAFAAAGMSGWIGPQILDAIASLIQKATGISAKEAAGGSTTLNKTSAGVEPFSAAPDDEDVEPQG
ncbi:MAG: phage holin family protein [Oscillospiraceae bacterium]|jgi:hypothetical protein|nr:phage holin family protein [Oscillospiraceae bacterium]